MECFSLFPKEDIILNVGDDAGLDLHPLLFLHVYGLVIVSNVPSLSYCQLTNTKQKNSQSITKMIKEI